MKSSGQHRRKLHESDYQPNYEAEHNALFVMNTIYIPLTETGTPGKKEWLRRPTVIISLSLLSFQKNDISNQSNV